MVRFNGWQCLIPRVKCERKGVSDVSSHMKRANWVEHTVLWFYCDLLYTWGVRFSFDFLFNSLYTHSTRTHTLTHKHTYIHTLRYCTLPVLVLYTPAKVEVGVILVCVCFCLCSLFVVSVMCVLCECVSVYIPATFKLHTPHLMSTSISFIIQPFPAWLHNVTFHTTSTHKTSKHPNTHTHTQTPPQPYTTHTQTDRETLTLRASSTHLLSLKHTLSDRHTHSQTHTHTPRPTHTLTPTPSHHHTHTHPGTHTLRHTHTHRDTHTHTPTHIHYLPCYQFLFGSTTIQKLQKGSSSTMGCEVGTCYLRVCSCVSVCVFVGKYFNYPNATPTRVLVSWVDYGGWIVVESRTNHNQQRGNYCDRNRSCECIWFRFDSICFRFDLNLI